MKMKSFAMLATSGLLAGYVAYITPAMADYTNSSNPSMQQSNPADNNANPTPPDGNDPNTNLNPLDNNQPAAQNNNNSGTANTDPAAEQATPDTATGDDDY